MADSNYNRLNISENCNEVNELTREVLNADTWIASGLALAPQQQSIFCWFFFTTFILFILQKR